MLNLIMEFHRVSDVMKKINMIVWNVTIQRDIICTMENALSVWKNSKIVLIVLFKLMVIIHSYNAVNVRMDII